MAKNDNVFYRCGLKAGVSDGMGEVPFTRYVKQHETFKRVNWRGGVDAYYQLDDSEKEFARGYIDGCCAKVHP